MNFKKIISFLIFICMFANICTVSFCTEDTIKNISNEENNIEEQISEEEQEEGMKIYSESAILIEAKTGKILYEKNIHDRKYPASTTKILTAILALEKCDLDEKATVSKNAINSLEDGYAKADIQIGETFTIAELLDVMMVQSANEAAVVIAEHISGSVSEFAKLMNQKAKEIGCTDSNFVNPNGMHNENHYSSAYDLALIAKYCMKNETFRKLANKMECSLPRTEYWQDEQIEEHGERNFKNTNKLLIEGNRYYYPYAIGIKTGFTTPAKNCLISASNKDGFETIAVVLHAETTEDGLSARYLDTINLFEYGYSNYKLEDIQKEYPADMFKEVSAVPDVEQENIEGIEKKFETYAQKDVDLTIEFFEIAIGIVLIIIAFIMIFSNRKPRKGKHEYNENIYKFKLN